MVDFVGLLRRTIDAQSSATPALRRRIYDRTRETVEKQMSGKNIAAEIQALQRRILEKAILEVESHYDAPAAESARLGGQADVFAALQKNAGMKANAPQPSFNPAAFAGDDDAAPAAPFAAYHKPAERGQARQAAGGNAYFARPAAAEGSVMSEAAYGGDYGNEEDKPLISRDFSARRGGNERGGAVFSLDEEKAEKENFSPYRQNRGFETPYSPYETSGRGSARSYAGADDVFARRSLDEPIEALPDFDDDFTLEPAGGKAPAAKASGAYYQPSYQDYAPPPAAAEPKQRPKLSPYNIEQETLAEYVGGGYADAAAEPHEERAFARQGNFAPPEPEMQTQTAEQNYSRDFSSLHNFLFGEAKPQNGAANAASLPEEAYAQAEPAAADFTAAAEPSMRASIYSAAEQNAAENEPSNARFSPLPDFLAEEEQTGSAAAPFGAAKADSDYPFAPQFTDADESGETYAALQPLPEDLLRPQDELAADVLLPEMQSGKGQTAAYAEDSGSLAGGAGNRVASGIFAQAAIQEKRRSGKRRLLTGGAIILALLLLLGGIFWFLTDFLREDKHGIAALVNAGQTDQAPRADTADKANQRLTPDGREIDAAPAAEQAAPSEAEVKTAPAEAEAAAQGDVIFREARTALMPANSAKGIVAWSLLREKTPEGANDTVLRGELSVPERDMLMRLTIRPNHDKNVPAIYLAELMFTVPENFEGVAIDKISPIMFKATEESTGQELLDTRLYKINNNFFVITLNSPEDGRNPKLQRNIALMEQLPWLSVNVAYKNGRIGEFTFGKGESGGALFKQFFAAQSAANQGLTAGENAALPPAQGASAPAPKP